jgi:prepilin-type N-terminal cleavage/methylation domain-containing protein
MKKNGLTLLEILVAAMIMALVMAGIANIFIAAKKHIFHARFRMTSSELGHWFLDPLAEDVRLDELLSGSNCLSNDGTTGCPGDQTVDSRTYSPEYAIGDAVSGSVPAPLSEVRKVKLDINWDESTL